MIYLTAKDVIKINAKVIFHYSKGEIIGIKEPNALVMAIKQPSQTIFSKELFPTIYDKASILVINLAKKHPFHNGNKRTAFVAMVTFLELNGYTTTFSQQEAIQFIVDITTSKKNFDQLRIDTAKYLQEAGKIKKK